MPAGTFRAIRIQYFTKRYQEEYWYAPAVRWWVKLSTSTNWHTELQAFKLFPPPERN